MIEITSTAWIDVYQVTGIAVSTKIFIQNQSTSGTVRLAASTTPPAANADGILLSAFPGRWSAVMFDPKAGTMRVYARAEIGDSLLHVVDGTLFSNT